MAPPIKYAYPAGIGCELRQPIEPRRPSKYVMSCASAYAVRRGWVYRCRVDGEYVVIRRVA